MRLAAAFILIPAICPAGPQTCDAWAKDRFVMERAIEAQRAFAVVSLSLSGQPAVPNSLENLSNLMEKALSQTEGAFQSACPSR